MDAVYFPDRSLCSHFNVQRPLVRSLMKCFVAVLGVALAFTLGPVPVLGQTNSELNAGIQFDSPFPARAAYRSAAPSSHSLTTRPRYMGEPGRSDHSDQARNIGRRALLEFQQCGDGQGPRLSGMRPMSASTTLPGLEERRRTRRRRASRSLLCPPDGPLDVRGLSTSGVQLQREASKSAEAVSR